MRLPIQSHLIAALLVLVLTGCGGKAESQPLGSSSAESGGNPATSNEGSGRNPATSNEGSGGAPAATAVSALGGSASASPLSSSPSPTIDVLLGTGMGAAKSWCSAVLDRGPEVVDALVDESLCNGSPEVRLVVRSAESSKCSAVSKTLPTYSAQFLIVTGDCRYWASVDHMQGIREGHLSPAEEIQLSADVGIHEFCREIPTTNCANPRVGLPFPEWSLAVGGHEVSGCVGEAQGVVQPPPADPLTVARRWTQKLALDGAPSQGTALLLVDGPLADTYAWPHFASWPLPRDLAALGQLPKGTTTEITDRSELDALRTLRSGFVDEPLVVFYCSAKIRTDAGTRYDVIVLDELPPDVKLSLVRFDAKLGR